MFFIKHFVHAEMSIDLWIKKGERQTELQLEQNYCTWLWPSSYCKVFSSLTRGNSTIALCATDTNKEIPLSIAKYSHWHYDKAVTFQVRSNRNSSHSFLFMFIKNPLTNYY